MVENVIQTFLLKRPPGIYTPRYRGGAPSGVKGFSPGRDGTGVAKGVNPWRGDSAFTLIEMLVALATMGLILGAAYTTLFSGMDAYTTSARESNVYTVLTRSMERMFRDLSCAAMGEQGFRFIVENDSLTTDTQEDLPIDRLRFQGRLLRLDWRDRPQSDLSEIEYFIADEEEDAPARWLIRRTQSPADSDLEEGGEIHLVGPRVIGLNVEAFDGSKWLEEWDSTSELPQAVRIRLFMEPEERESDARDLETVSSIVWIPTAGGTATTAPIEAEAEAATEEEEQEPSEPSDEEEGDETG
jgi:type II secretion system protein J